MFAVADRIFETSVTPGAGTYTLAGAQPGFQSFSAIGADNECTYFATDDTHWEVGIGKYITGPNRLTRETILASSNAGAAINWGGQTVKLRVSVPAAGLTAKRMLSKSVAGAANVTLTQDEQRRQVLKLTGVLTGNIDVIVDTTIWSWIVHNATAGAFTLTVKTTAGAGVAVQQGTKEQLYCDGVDVLSLSRELATLLTTKGDVAIRDATGPVRKAVPANGRVRMADSAQADGWLDVPTTFNWRNRLINPDGGIYQRAVAATVADDTYFADRWYMLTQTSTVTPSVLTDPEDGHPKGVRITQSQAAAQRFGFAQIIEGKNCKDLRGQSGVLVPRVRISNSQAIRYAILAWTGTEDAVTSDVVNDWTSADYSDGAAKFFVDANITPLVVGAQTPGANVWTSLAAITAALGSAFNNLIVVVWTEGTAAQNVTLDFDYVQLERGNVATEFERRAFPMELVACQRYFEKTYDLATAPQTVTVVGAAQFIDPISGGYWQQRYAVRKRAIATVTHFSPATGASGQIRDNSSAADIASAGVVNSGESHFVLNVAGHGAGDETISFHWTADAEL